MSQYRVYHSDVRKDPNAHGIEREQLARIDADLVFIPRGKGARELAQLMTNADAIIVAQAPITRQVLTSMPNCKAVVRYGVGVDTLDLEAATECGVVCAHAPDFCLEEVANHTLMLLLAAAKRLPVLDRSIRSKGWLPNPMGPVPHFHGQTMGLIACGNIARAFAQRCRALSLKVLGHDPYLDDGTAREAGIKLVDLDDLLARSDFISVHLPLTEKTRHMVNADVLAKMKSTAILINTSRGPVVDEVALIDALEKGVIAGAGLDVFEVEPLPHSPLTTMDNVVLTPHVASTSDFAQELIARRVGESVVDVLSGHWPRFVANKGILDRLDLKPTLHPD